MSVIGAIGGALGQLGLNTFSNWLQGRMNLKNSKDAMDYQSDKQLEMQTKLNQMLYPQQVSSMRMAGLNPAMMSGPSSAQTAGMPSSSQNMNAAQADFLGAAQAASTLKLNESQQKLNEASANDLNASAELKRKEGDIKENELFTWFENKQIEWQDIINRTNKNAADTAVSQQQHENLKQEFEVIKKNLDIAVEQVNKLQAEQGYTKEQTRWIAPQARAQIHYYSQEAGYLAGKNKRESDKLFYEIEDLKAGYWSKNNLGNYYRSQKDAVDFALEMDRQFMPGERWLGIWNNANSAFWDTFTAPFKSSSPFSPTFGKTYNGFNPRNLRR